MIEQSKEMSDLHRLRQRIECFLLFGPSSSSDSIANHDQGEKSTFQLSHLSTSVNPPSFEDDASRRSYLLAMKLEVDRLLATKAVIMDPRKQILTEKCLNIRDKTLCGVGHIEDRDDVVRSAFERFMKAKYKLQLLEIAQATQKLAVQTNILRIADNVLDIKSLAKVVILDQSKLYKKIQEVVQAKKQKLLIKFHRLFEDHLETERTNSMSELNKVSPSDLSDHQQMSQIWELFLVRSRQWLLAYALISVLPAVLSQSHRAALELFQDALDEAMTPLWGRFYHHLKIGRESRSFNQILWTFKYAKSFIEMVHSLCLQITAADQMKALLPSQTQDFSDAAERQVINKSLKFLQAHLADVLVHFTPWDDVFGMQLIDEILEFDSWFCSYRPTTTLCGVIYDSKYTFHHWLHLEHSSVYKHFYSLLSDPVAASSCYEMMFQSSSGGQSLRCYRCLYEALKLFMLARERYFSFPFAVQMILSEVILEPLLCFGLGLLLFKVRSDRSLFEISIGNKKGNADDVSKTTLRKFKDSVLYYQSALGKEQQKFVVASGKRCRNKWNIIQNWMPKIFISQQQQTLGFSIVDMLKIAMKLSDKFKAKELSYRANSILSVASTQKGDVPNEDDQSVDSCVVMARGLAITLVEVLEDQL